MPACRASQFRSTLVSLGHLRSHAHRQGAISRVLCNYGLRRQASTAQPLPQASTKQPTDDPGALRNRTQTLLYKAEKLLPRILPESSDISEAGTLPFWKDVLHGAYVDLNSDASEGPARIVVYGCDEHAGAKDLVTALLEEPFAPPSRNEAIRERWKGADEHGIFHLSHGFTQFEAANSLRIPSSWLQQFSVPVEIGELPSTQLSANVLRALYAADIPIVVCNPISTPIPKVLSENSLLLSHRNAILVVTASPSSAPELADYIAQQVPTTLKVIFTDPRRAVDATQTLGSTAASSSAVQQYQDDFTGSHVSDLTAAIAEKLTAAAAEDAHIRTVTARELTKVSLVAFRDALDRASSAVDKVALDSIDVKDMVAVLEARAEVEVLGSDANEVKASVDKAKKEIKVTLDRLNWWRFIWRVDDIGETMLAAVDKAWCRDLEDKLIFHSGRLASSQQELTITTTQLITSYPPACPFFSSVLMNRLEQLQTAPSYPVSPASLTTPIHARRAQMAYPTTLLHTTAQRVTLGMGSSVLSGFAVAWAGWAEHLGMFGGLVSTGMHVETAVGAGMLVGVLGLRLMVGKWDSARKRWWRDLERVGEGLERDLKTTLNEVVAQQVTLIPREACQGLDDLAEKRKDEIEALKEELEVLEEEAKVV